MNTAVTSSKDTQDAWRRWFSKDLFGAVSMPRVLRRMEELGVERVTAEELIRGYAREQRKKIGWSALGLVPHGLSGIHPGPFLVAEYGERIDLVWPNLRGDFLRRERILPMEAEEGVEHPRFFMKRT